MNEKDLHLHSVSTAAFLAQLKRSKVRSLGQATQGFLLCKVAIQRRKIEITERQRCGADVSDLERMVKRLEASMRAHKALIDEITSDEAEN